MTKTANLRRCWPYYGKFGRIKKKKYLVTAAVACIIVIYVVICTRTDVHRLTIKHVLTQWLNYSKLGGGTLNSGVNIELVPVVSRNGPEHRLGVVERQREVLSLTTVLKTPITAYSNSLVDAIATRASKDRYIVLAMVDGAFIDMASNLHEASLAPHHIDNYLFVGVGSSACDVLRRQSLACFHYVDDPSAGRDSAYGNADFIRKMNIRTDMILEALAANFTVVHTDLDVAFLHNPFDEIRVNYFVVPCIICYSV